MSDDMKGMWDTLPGHTFIRGLWRVSETPLSGYPETMIESYELLTEDPDALTAAEARIAALEAENAKLVRQAHQQRAALEAVRVAFPKLQLIGDALEAGPGFDALLDVYAILRKALDGGGE